MYVKVLDIFSQQICFQKEAVLSDKSHLMVHVTSLKQLLILKGKKHSRRLMSYLQDIEINEEIYY